MEQPSAPPSETTAKGLSPDAARRIDESRFRAKAIRQAREDELRRSGKDPETYYKGASGIIEGGSAMGAAGPRNKRPFSAVSGSESVPATNRDGRVQPADGPIRPAKNFAKFVDFNMSSMKNTKGGFITEEDDPFNTALKKGVPGSDRPKHMTAKEWERFQTLRNLKRTKQGPFEPGLSVLTDEAERKRCRECASLEIDFVWDEVFKTRICHTCKDKFPEKYSFSRKQKELRDEDLLPHLNKPNPHKSHWHDMMLFLRYQVEEYAIQEKWGSAEALDAEFAKREEQKKKRKEAKFKERLLDLKKKTRTEAFRRQQSGVKGPTKFGEALGGESMFIVGGGQWRMLME
ncbi:unnamed protein product [Parascedosporium putredinis]|uniref:XPA C-terminal domain-containing protein n=1 Tax=Parascedosporium putredinis TaxID=1442378 RepID=A0A9P1MDI2_9PEZI|nr:unnamed protein product [Parascedosporium putredinis]CAI7999697.1 unnamed protein product [Parascedosporium putredinis]